MNRYKPIRKLTARVLTLAAALILSAAFTLPASADTLPIVSGYAFQPDGTPYHYYGFGDELFYNVSYDGVGKSYGVTLEGMPEGTPTDEWMRDIMPINGMYQLINARYKQDVTDDSQYPKANRDMLLAVIAEGQNGSAQFDRENGSITLYMKPGADAAATEIGVAVTSLGYQYFQGQVWWSLTNDMTEKAKLEELYRKGVEGTAASDDSGWEAFGELFNASMDNSVDLSKETWLTVCGGMVSGYYLPVFAQYKLVWSVGENPLKLQPVLTPRTAEFDKRLLYRSNVIFNITDYTKQPVNFLINGNAVPENAVTYSNFMCVVNAEYLSSLANGDAVSLTVKFSDNSEDTVSINVKDTTAEAYKAIFSDVGTDTAAWEYIHPLIQKGIIDGSGGEYRPGEAVSRAEFYDMLKKAGAQMETDLPLSEAIPASEAEKLLFDTLTSKQFETRYKALNKQHIWMPNVYNDLTVDNFIFLDAAGASADAAVTLTRAQAAEAVYRFVRLLEYADELIVKQNPAVTPTSSTILIDSKEIAFEAYNIEWSNYFKLRDLAYVLNGTSKQLSVDYSSETKGVTLTPGEPYTAVGGEMEGKGGVQTASMSRVELYLGGRYYTVMAYNIGGNNYFKLRDVATLLNFGVDWDGTKNTVSIDTSKAYTP
ncbi:MAG: S-layer homology domain-containing protein [Clostridiales Family XIII bacterium]|nr:S-layer homology domain-containing protein [Clostridiales Family XIII bacterium]